jgi:hypothetical protein
MTSGTFSKSLQKERQRRSQSIPTKRFTNSLIEGIPKTLQQSRNRRRVRENGGGNLLIAIRRASLLNPRLFPWERVGPRQ